MRDISISQICLGLVIATALSCNDNHNATKNSKNASFLIDSSVNMLKSGDVMLRSGKSFTSMLLSSFNTKDKTYSHVGVLIVEEGIPYVYHAIGGEDNPDATIRKEHVISWCNPSYNSGFAAMRYRLDSNEKKRFLAKVVSYYKHELKFDIDFDLKTDSALYCTEMVYKAMGYAIDNNYWLTPSTVAMGSYIGVDDLFLHPSAKFICRVKF